LVGQAGFEPATKSL